MKKPEDKKQDTHFSHGDKFRIGFGVEHSVESFETGEDTPSGYQPAIVRFSSMGYQCWEYAYKCQKK